MSGGLALLLPLVAVGALLCAVLMAVPRRRRLVALNEVDFPQLSRLRITNAAARVVAVVAGLVLVVPLVGSLRFGLGLLLAPAVFAITQILATVVAGILTHGAARTEGTAGLEVRRVTLYLPRRLAALVAAAMAVLSLVLVGTTVTAEPDDMGFPGRAFSYAYACDGVCSRGFSPWPGAYYSLPLAVALAVVVALAALGVVITVRRPRDASDPEIVRVDDLVRARAVESIVSAVGVFGGGTLAAVCFMVARLLGGPAGETPMVLLASGWGAVALTLGAVALAVWCVVVLLLPGATAPLRPGTTAPSSTAVSS